MMTSSRPAINLPYEHYAMIYLDSEGKLKVHESSSIQEQNSTVFTPEVRQNFLEILGERIGFHQPTARGMLSSFPRNQHVLSSNMNQAPWTHRLAESDAAEGTLPPPLSLMIAWPIMAPTAMTTPPATQARWYLSVLETPKRS